MTKSIKSSIPLRCPFVKYKKSLIALYVYSLFPLCKISKTLFQYTGYCIKDIFFMRRLKDFAKRYPFSLLISAAILYVSLSRPPGLVILFTHSDWLIHFAMYLIFCIMVWCEYYKSHAKPNYKALFWGAVAAPAIFSGVVEFMQSLLTSYRSADYADFLFNVSGVLFAALIGKFVIEPLFSSRK